MKSLSLQIQTVVFNVQENNTCYFQNPLRLLKCFQNYLNSLDVYSSCLGLGVNQKKRNPYSQYNSMLKSVQDINIFAQKLNVKQLIQHPLSFQLLQAFRFINLRQISFHQNSQMKIQQNIRLVQALFVIYIVCEHKRYKLSLQDISFNNQNNDILFDQTQSELREAQQFIKKLPFRYNVQTFNKKIFDINQQKFIKLLLIKSLQIKLLNQKSKEKNVQTAQKLKNIRKKQNNFENQILYRERINGYQNYCKKQTHQQIKQVIKNESLLIIKSQFFDQQSKTLLFSKEYAKKQHENFDLKLQFQELDQQDLFEYISLDIDY